MTAPGTEAGRTPALEGEAKILAAVLVEGAAAGAGDAALLEHLDGASPALLRELALAQASQLAETFRAVGGRRAVRRFAAASRRCGMHNIASGHGGCICAELFTP